MVNQKSKLEKSYQRNVTLYDRDFKLEDEHKKMFEMDGITFNRSEFIRFSIRNENIILDFMKHLKKGEIEEGEYSQRTITLYEKDFQLEDKHLERFQANGIVYSRSALIRFAIRSESIVKAFIEIKKGLDF